MSTIVEAEKSGGFSPPTFSGKFIYEVHQVTPDNKYDLIARAYPLHQVLNYEPGRVIREVIENMQENGEVVFARTADSEPKDVGFVAQRLVPVSPEGRSINVLSILTRVVAPEYQKQNVGTELMTEGIQRHDPDYQTGRTQSPFVLRGLERTEEFKDIIPIAKPHAYTTKMQLLLVLTLGLEGIRDVDLRNGLCKGVYPPGPNRAFVLDNASERVLEIYKIMTSPPIGAVIENGDAVRYLAPRDRKTRVRTTERKVDRTPENPGGGRERIVTVVEKPIAENIGSSPMLGKILAFFNRLLGIKTPATSAQK